MCSHRGAECCSHTHTFTRTYMHMRARACTHAYTHTRTERHTCIHIHTHKETCARADAQPRSPSSIWLLSASVGHSALVTGTLLILQDPLH